MQTLSATIGLRSVCTVDCLAINRVHYDIEGIARLSYAQSGSIALQNECQAGKSVTLRQLYAKD